MTFNWRCTFGLHPWPKWGFPYKRTIEYTAIEQEWGAYVRCNPPIITSELRQDRQCPACGKFQTRAIKP